MVWHCRNAILSVKHPTQHFSLGDVKGTHQALLTVSMNNCKIITKMLKTLSFLIQALELIAVFRQSAWTGCNLVIIMVVGCQYFLHVSGHLPSCTALPYHSLVVPVLLDDRICVCEQLAHAQNDDTTVAHAGVKPATSWAPDWTQPKLPCTQ